MSNPTSAQLRALTLNSKQDVMPRSLCVSSQELVSGDVEMVLDSQHIIAYVLFLFFNTNLQV